ncbi:MAG TPA: hydrogenase maturation nickel metallochaperone HypA [Anaerolineae bacterium]|jgi:hydrogenase nickel incorporation protein HypA/HybF|nr:hydrogenase maturation nickel metallochaperone HypA [Anaerolineae bacterium]
MHELGLTQSILDIALEHAERNNATKILTVTVKAGTLVGLVEDSMQFYFNYLTRTTIAEDAELIVEHLPAVVSCNSCGRKSEVSVFEVFTCPRCNGFSVELISGREFYVDSIEIE